MEAVAGAGFAFSSFESVSGGRGRSPLRVPIRGGIASSGWIFGQLSSPACHNPAMSFYRRNLPHLQRDKKPHFVTFVTKFRWALPDAARDIALKSCLHDNERKYDLWAVAV